jgi:GntR family transcriptional regulator
MIDDDFLLPPSGPLGRSAEEVRRRILEEISSGALRRGQRLGAERDLSKRYEVSRSTLRAALDALESAGVVRRSLGRTGGTFVADRRVERDLTAMAGLPTYLRRQGFEAGARVLSTATAEADEETARSLELATGAVVLEVVRVRLADGEPISLEHARFPAERFPGLLDRPLGGSLYSLLQSEYDLVPGEAVERIEIVSASPSTARVLGLSRTAPLMSVVRVATDSDGRPFELSHDLFRGDRVRIVVRAQADPTTAAMVAGSVEVSSEHN